MRRACGRCLCFCLSGSGGGSGGSGGSFGGAVHVYQAQQAALRNLVTELIDVANNDVNFGECTVRTAQSQINGRPATRIDVIHPTQRANFRFHKAELFIDNELQIPTRYAAYLWPAAPGEPPRRWG